MKTLYRLLGRVRTGLALGALGLGVAVSPVFAQVSTGSLAGKNVPRTCTNKTFFQLPIEIDAKSRSAVREVILYAKEGDGPWMKKDTAPPTQKHFSYQVPREGEYWFSVVTVDQMGRANPADVTKEPPMLIVVVDTTPPVVEINPVNLPNGQMALRCLIKDDNPDYQKLQVSYQGEGQSWQTLEPVPGMAGTFRLPDVPVLNGTVRYIVEDKARNKNTQEMLLKEQFPSSPVPSPAKGTPITQTPATPPSPSPNLPGVPPVPEAHGANHQSPPSSLGTRPMVADAPPLPPLNSTPYLTQNNQGLIPVSNNQVKPAPQNNSTESGTGLIGPDSSGLVPIANPNLSPVNQPARVSGGAGHQLINTQHAAIDYRLDKVGPSGVGKVDVWVKAETATAWQLLTTDHDRKSPAEIQLPHEGLFGIRLAVTNGNGFGGAPPRPNDPPAFWIEVDTTPPFAQLYPVGPVASSEVIDIRWTATDKNLGPEAVSLFYSTQRTGPWHPIAQNLKNNGQFSWHFPKDIGSQFYVRLEVTDEAGNLTRTELTQPVQLDLTEPEAQVVGVTGVAGLPGKN